MASLKDARGFAEELNGLSGRLQSELEKKSVDFDRLVQLSDEIGESADRLASTFSAINGSLAGLLEGREPSEDQNGGGNGEEGTPSRGNTEKASGRGGSRRRQARDGGQPQP